MAVAQSQIGDKTTVTNAADKPLDKSLKISAMALLLHINLWNYSQQLIMLMST